MKNIATAAALVLFLGVALGAFGAHGLKGRVSPEMLANWQTGVLYHLVHGLGMLLLAVLAHLSGVSLLRGAAWLHLAGITIFSGSLYLMTLTGLRWLGAVTPLGGLALLAGWLLAAYAMWRQS